MKPNRKKTKNRPCYVEMFPKNRGGWVILSPKWMVYFMEKPYIKWDDEWGFSHLFVETPIAKWLFFWEGSEATLDALYVS